MVSFNTVTLESESRGSLGNEAECWVLDSALGTTEFYGILLKSYLKFTMNYIESFARKLAHTSII